MEAINKKAQVVRNQGKISKKYWYGQSNNKTTPYLSILRHKLIIETVINANKKSYDGIGYCLVVYCLEGNLTTANQYARKKQIGQEAPIGTLFRNTIAFGEVIKFKTVFEYYNNNNNNNNDDIVDASYVKRYIESDVTSSINK